MTRLHIEVKNLIKEYKGTPAVRDVSLPVAGKVEGLKIVAESTVFSCDCELLLRKYEKSIKE